MRKQSYIRIIMFFIILFVGIQISDVKALAAVGGTCEDGLTWSLDGNGLLTISGSGPMKDYDFSGFAPWRTYESQIKSLKITSGVTSIGNMAFYGCSELTDAEVSDYIVSIGNQAFYGTDLMTINMPSRLKTIGDIAFMGCSLEQVELPDTLESLGSSAFGQCALSEVSIPAHVKNITNNPFSSCKSLTKITISSQNEFYMVYDNCIYNKAGTKLICCPAGKRTVDLLETTVTLENRSFSDCDKISDIYIPKSVITIENYAFYTDVNSKSNRNIYFYGNAPTIEADSFYDVRGNVYYSSIKTGWDSVAELNYGGTLTWIAKSQMEYIIQFNKNDGSGTITIRTKYDQKPLTIDVTFLRTGYTLKGWSTSSTATSAMYRSGDTYTSNSGTTLYAVWEANTYSVYYNANGGTGAPSMQTKTYGIDLTLSDIVPTRTGYIFLGWSPSSTATSASYSAKGKYSKEENVTLYAVWKANDNSSGGNGNNGTGSGNQGGSSTGTGSGNQGGSSTGTGSGNQGGSSTGTGSGSQNGTNTDSNGNNTSTGNMKKVQSINVSSKTVAYKSKPFYLNAKAQGKLSYQSTNKKAAVVSSKGRITVKGYGQTTIIIRAAATGNYKAAVKKITIKVVPKKVQWGTVKSVQKRSVRYSWKKDKTVSGYQFYLSVNKNFKSKTVQRFYTGKTKLPVTLKNLKSKKTYYIKIRAYKTVNKKRYYGAWSSVKKVKVK